MLAHHAGTRGDAPFIVFESSDGSVEERTFAETESYAARAASLLSELGLEKGDPLHVHLPNTPAFYDCWFGAAKLGVLLTPTNPLATADEISYVVGHAGCKVSVTTTELEPAVAAAGSPRVLTTDELQDALVSRPPIDAGAHIQGSDPAAILYTSGTTSRPKGVLVTNANYLHVGRVVAGHLRLSPDDRWLIVLPLFHANAQYYSTMSALVTGCSVAVMERFSASRWVQQAARHAATVASLFAAPIRMILAQPARPDDGDNRLRAVLFSQNVTEAQLAEFEERFDCPLLQLYGMTETVAPPLVNPLEGDRRNMSIGLPTSGSIVRILDEDGRDVPPGEVGRLVVAGEPGRTIMAGYLDDPDATVETIRDGWLHTGDNVRSDEDGYLYFVDRSKDMIKRAGENVAAGEVEAVVNAHPGVFESAAIGVPDPMRDEAIKVYVVPKEGVDLGPEEIVAWCGERLAHFKVPSHVEVVAELPKTSVGKIQKGVLRRREGADNGKEPRAQGGEGP
jgi:crotonobetaine/carnitine-CoA ligase